MKSLILIAFFLFGISVADAQMKLVGSFMAAKACLALQSIKKGTNPGNVSVEVGKSYVLLGKNKEPASHYWIEVPGAQPLQRWVGADCGAADGAVVSAPAQTHVPVAPAGEKKPFYVLSMSWEPAFCEAMAAKVECQRQTAASFEATHLVLHGLWPQPRRRVFCNVDKAMIAADDAHQWEKLLPPELSATTKASLDEVMPGTQSLLERHEWVKHGSCYPGGKAESYFTDAINLMKAINSSPVQAFLSAHVGQTIQTSELRMKFDEAFGKGAGERVRVACKPDGNRQIVTEITLGLKGDISAGQNISQLIAQSQPTDAGCPSGEIDSVGLQ